MRYDYEPYHSLLLADKHLTKDAFVNRCGAKGGYTLWIFGEIYDIIYSEAENVNDLYEKYYKLEYKDLYDFLYKKYTMPKERVSEFQEAMERNTDLVIWDVDQFSYGGYDNQFVFSDEYYDRFDKIIMMED